MVTLTVYRYRMPVTFTYETVKEAAEQGVVEMEHGESLPVRIEDEAGNVMWKFDGGLLGLEKAMDELYRLAGREI